MLRAGRARAAQKAHGLRYTSQMPGIRLGASRSTSERASFFRSSRPCPKLNGGVAGLTLEYPTKVLFIVESASIADLFDAQISAAQQFARTTDVEVQAASASANIGEGLPGYRPRQRVKSARSRSMSSTYSDCAVAEVILVAMVVLPQNTILGKTPRANQQQYPLTLSRSKQMIN